MPKGRIAIPAQIVIPNPPKRVRDLLLFSFAGPIILGPSSLKKQSFFH
jgi:hypothetical protein